MNTYRKILNIVCARTNNENLTISDLNKKLNFINEMEKY